MNEPIFRRDEGNRMLEKVHEGMTVYDHEDKAIGKVDQVYFGEVDEAAEERGKGPQGISQSGITQNDNDRIDFAFGGATSLNDNLEGVDDVLRNRLAREGFIRVDTSGLFSSDAYALPDQIASISGDGVHLNVDRDDLIRPR